MILFKNKTLSKNYFNEWILKKKANFNRRDVPIKKKYSRSFFYLNGFLTFSSGNIHAIDSDRTPPPLLVINHFVWTTDLPKAPSTTTLLIKDNLFLALEMSRTRQLNYLYLRGFFNLYVT